MSHRIRSRPKGIQGHDALFVTSSYRDTAHFTEDERGRIADAKRSEILDVFALVVKEVMPAHIPADMERFYIGFFKKAVPYEPLVTVPQSFRDLFGDAIQFWIAEGIAAVIDSDGYLRTFIPAALIIPPQREEAAPVKSDGGKDDGWRRARHGAYTAYPSAFSIYLNDTPNKACFGRGTLH